MNSLNELILNFNEAKLGDLEAINFLVNYFMNNVEKQLQNTHLNFEDNIRKSSNCRQVIIRNIHICYDANEFISETLKDIKNIIYLDQVNKKSGSRDIVTANEAIIRSKISAEDLNMIKVPIVYRELARLYYIENKTIKELSEIEKTSETIIYYRLRKIADALLKRKASNYVLKEKASVYRK